VSRWGDYAGPPAILPTAYHEEALSLRGDAGARALLYAQGRPRPAEVVNPRAPYDLDSPRDLTVAQALSATLRGRCVA
jgi:CTP:molybdopterin cytidylyltransferase MocA